MPRKKIISKKNWTLNQVFKELQLYLLSISAVLIMSGRDLLYRSVLRANQESPQLQTSLDMSPMSSLTFNLQNLSHATPKRRLSLSSNVTDTPSSLHDGSLHFSSFLFNASSEAIHSASGCEDAQFPHKSSPSRQLSSRNDKCSPSPLRDEKSPSRRLPSRDKENFQSPYFSPSHSRSTKPQRPHSSPLKEVQNTCNRNLNFSPLKKISPSKRQSNTPRKPSPPEDFDTNSQDSGYSESGKKLDEECFSVPVNCAPRKLDLDLSPAKSQTRKFNIDIRKFNIDLSPAKSQTRKFNIDLSPAKSQTGKFNIDLSPPKTQIVISPPKAISSSTPVSRSSSSSRAFSSLSKCDDEDTILMDLMNEVGSVEDSQPTGFTTLLSAPINVKKTSVKPVIQRRGSLFTQQRLPIRRCLSMMENTPTSSRTTSVIDNNTPTSSRVECESSPVKITSCEVTSFKRPAPPANLCGMVDAKRRKSEAPTPFQTGTTTIPALSNISNIPLVQRQTSVPSPSNGPKHKLFRSNSESQVSIMKALSKSANIAEKLTGDLSRPIALPTIQFGKHPDLPTISHDTLADLMEGRYKDTINSYKIIDCRYPYEFNGGHIQDAVSWHNPQMVLDHLASQKNTPVIPSDGQKRDVLIFHCEFSAERGPKAQRLLREKDRTASTNYPALHFPELYLLEGGYRVFYQQYPDLCTPEGYTMMLDVNFTDDLKHFRAKSKSWASDNKQTKSRGLPRTGLKRLGL